MPELPEVETIRRGLSQLIVGKQVKRVDYDTPKSFPNAEADVAQFLIGASIIDVRRRAKVLLIDLDSQYTLVIHLKMTGQIVFVNENLENKTETTSYSSGHAPADQAPQARWGAGHPTDSLVNKLPDRSTRVTLELDDQSRLFFNDQRKFGWMKLLPSIEVPNIDFMKRVGPEPLEADFTAAEFAQRFKRRSRTSIKAALLDQTVVAGVGNIYADEALWGARIHPGRLVGSVQADEFELLFDEVRAVMNLSIEKGGSTDRNYINAEGKRGSYLDFARVFRREGQPCLRCGQDIVKLKVAGRGTHICPDCQVE